MTSAQYFENHLVTTIYPDYNIPCPDAFTELSDENFVFLHKNQYNEI